jgi:hypothetical protein
VAGDQGAFDLGQHGVLETEQTGPDVVAGGQPGQQILADLLLDSTLDMTGSTQLADGAGQVVR